MTQEQATALLAIAVAFGVPLGTLFLTRRSSDRTAFQSEAMARIQMLRDQLEDCRKQLPFMPPIAGGEDGETEPFMLDVAERLRRSARIPEPGEE